MTKSVSSSFESTTSPCTKAAQRVSKKYNISYRRKLQRKEYKNLKKVLPSLNTAPKVSKTDVIEEAIKYIDYLHAEIANRFYSGGVFRQAKEDSPMADVVKRLALHPHKKLAPQPYTQQTPSHPAIFQYSQSFIEAGSQLAGPEFLHYRQALKSTSALTAKHLPSCPKPTPEFSGKTVQLRL